MAAGDGEVEGLFPFLGGPADLRPSALHEVLRHRDLTVRGGMMQGAQPVVVGAGARLEPGLTVPYLPGTVVHVNSAHAVLPRVRSQLSYLGNVRILFRTCAMYERDLVPGKKKERKKVGTAVTAVTKNLYTRTLTQPSQRNLYM